MDAIIYSKTVLLISPSLRLKEKIKTERAVQPTVLLDTLESGCRYLKCFNDAEVIYIDGSILNKDSIPQIEIAFHQINPHLKIVYLLNSKKEKAKLSLPKRSLFRLLKITT